MRYSSFVGRAFFALYADQSFKYSHWIAASFMRHRVLSRRDNRSLYGRNEAAPDYGAIFCFGLACYE